MAADKTYRIGEVAQMLNLKTHVLRFWETEFPQLAPERAESGQRLYTGSDIHKLRRIQQLLHEQGMTIDGARRVLAGAPDDSGDMPTPLSENDLDFIAHIKTELEEIRKLLENTPQI